MSISAISSVQAVRPQAAPIPTSAAVSKAADALAAGPAATVQLSQAAQAKLAGDKDWTPGSHIDSF